MAQLASCPRCESEFVLPVVDQPGCWAKCPECSEEFALAEVIVRPLAEATIVPTPSTLPTSPPLAPSPLAPSPLAPSPLETESSFTESSGIEEVDEPATSDLAAGDLEAKEETTSNETASEERTSDEKPVTLSSLLSTDSKSKKSGNASPSDQSPSGGSSTFGGPSTFGGSTLASYLPKDEQPTSEPTSKLSKPTLSEVLQKGEDLLFEETSSTEDDSDLEGFDDFVADVMEEEEEAVEEKEKEASSSSEQPTFDFGVGDRSDRLLEETQPTSIDDFDSSFDTTFGTDLGNDSPDDDSPESDSPTEVPLEVEELEPAAGLPAGFGQEQEEHDWSSGSPALNVSQESVSGSMATRKRSSGPSPFRFMIGIASSGVAGIVIGYPIMLWIIYWRGQTADPLGLADYYPDMVKPSIFCQSTDDGSPTTEVVNEGESQGANAPVTPSEDRSQPSQFAQEKFQDPIAEEPNYRAPEVESPVELDPSEPEPPQLVQVSGVERYSDNQVRELADVARQAAPGLMAGRFSDVSTRQTKGGSYARLANLAHAITFAPEDAEPSLTYEAGQVFPLLFKLKRHRQEIAMIADAWWQSKKRKHGGIFFSGQFDQGVRQGSVMEYNVKLPTGKEIIIVTREPLPASLTQASSIGLVGVGLTKPASRIDGYTGESAMVVWSNNFFPID